MVTGLVNSGIDAGEDAGLGVVGVDGAVVTNPTFYADATPVGAPSTAPFNPSAFEQAMGSLARGGTLVCVGLPADNGMRVPIFETVLGGLTIRGSIVGTHRDLEETFELHRRGLTRVLRSECRLDDVNDAIEQVLDGSAPAPRMVFDMAPIAAGKVATGATTVSA